MELSSSTPRFSPLEPIFAGHTNIPTAFKKQFLHDVDGDETVYLEGSMEKIWHKPSLSWLFKRISKFGILIHHVGEKIPVTLKISKGRTDQGTPYYGWRRLFDFPDKPTFDTVVIYDVENQFLLDLVGTKKQLYMAWDAEYHPKEKMMTLNNRSYGIKISKWVFWLPKWFWRWTIGYEKFNQYADPDDPDITYINLRVMHPLFGKIFQYNGTF